jgi:class 3 adenylate cyclase/tetratricopeptide (TPR) repeat protein
MPETNESLRWSSGAKPVQELWQRRAEWIGDSEKARAFVKHAIREGDFLTAYDAVREIIERLQNNDPWMHQQMALALAQLGSTARAQAILTTLSKSDPTNRETLALLARTYKDQWCADTSNEAALNSAFEWYNRAFQIDPPDYYPGINAASLALLRNDRATAHRLAGQVLDICRRKLAVPSQDEIYWLRVTLAEALVILGRRTEAKKAYRSAAATGDLGLRELSSSRRQARLLSKHLYGKVDIFDACFPIPKLVAFSGHMLDSPGRHTPRFRPSYERTIRSAIDKQLDTIQAGIGFASAACGSDIIFLEAMLDHGATVHVVLPWPKDQFIKTSVAIVKSGNWVKRFEKILGQAASVRFLGQLHFPGSAIGFDYCNSVMVGLARLYARSLDLELVPMAVWDGLPGAPGGTGSFVRYWRAHDVPIKIIPTPVRASARNPETQSVSNIGEDVEDDFERWIHAAGRQELKAIMFADVTSYTRLSEDDLPVFIGQFSQRISRLIAESAFAPSNVNTWGDAYFFAFNHVEQAGRFALELRDMVKTTNWADLGLPGELSIRIAVHAGPVYVTFDPVSRQMTFAGAHVVRAARIEPVARAGEVFASEEFAALAAAEEAQGFSCDFVGTTQLAKSYGFFRIYSLVRADRRLTA